MKILNIVAWVLVVGWGGRGNGFRSKTPTVPMVAGAPPAATAVGVEEADAAAPLANKLEIARPLTHNRSWPQPRPG